MKKLISAIMAMTLVSALATSVSAVNVTENDSNPKEVQTEITTSISPSYIVTIPENLNIPFNSTSTVLGTVKATKLQLIPNKCITVSASAGKLQNLTDTTKALPYKLMNGENEFTSISFTDTTAKADLSVEIAQNDWNTAPAGSYKGTVTFTVAYADIEAN